MSSLEQVTLWARNEDARIVNAWCSIPSTVTAELIARAGFDAVTIDLQHGLSDLQTALPMLQIIDGLGLPVLVRVPWLEPGIIMKVLDFGASGIICPMINTPEEAKRLVDYCRYAPKGQRSFGPTRAGIAFGADYATKANDHLVILPMIETSAALERAEEIASVEGVSGVYVGPADLGLSLGATATLAPTAPHVLAAIDTILAAARRAGKFAGTHCGTPEMVTDMHAKGFRLATLSTDTRLFSTVLAESLAQVRAKKTDVAATY